MKNKLVSTLLRVALPTATRHLLAALAGVLAISPEADLTTYITAALIWTFTWLWSLAERHIAFLRDVSTDIAPQIDKVALIRQAARAAASQLVAAASGALLEHGYTGDPNDTLAITTWSANYLHSLSIRPAKAAKPLLALALLLTISCSHQKHQTPEGEITEATNVLSKGGIIRGADGSLTAFGDASQAGKDLAAIARASIAAGIISTGIGAAKDLGNTGIQAAAK